MAVSATLSKNEVREFAAKVLSGINGAMSYSGRGMFGESCVGIVTDRPEVTRAEIVEDVAYYLSQEGIDDYESLVRVLSYIFRQERIDDYGMDVVIYFPDIPATYVEEDEE